MIHTIRQALGRTTPHGTAPVPPAIPEPLVRLVHSELGLAELFARQAAENKMSVEPVYVEELLPRLIAFLHDSRCQRIALPTSALFDKLNLPDQLRQYGFDLLPWDQIALDDLYSADAGLTDVYCAVAETGSLVIRSSPAHGKAISLIPPIHVAIVEPRNILPDLVDLFDKLAREGIGSNVTLITGPSKTADIEMNLVTGVHGPGVVKVFVLK